MPNNLTTVEKATHLLKLAWDFSGMPIENLTSMHFERFAKSVSDETGLTLVGKSIQNFIKSLETADWNEAGFHQNITKETLAAFVLKKSAKITSIEQEPRLGKRPGPAHPKRIYWDIFVKELPELPKNERVPEAEMDMSYRLEPIPDYFQDTRWFVYSRAPSGLIYRHLLTIKKEKCGKLNQVVMENASSRVEDYIGQVGTDIGSDYLIFNLFTAQTRQKHLHIKIKLGEGTFPAFMAGQSSFISSIRAQVMSDTNLFQKVAEDEAAMPKKFPRGTQEYRSLPLCIRRYFFDLKNCRLSSPKEDIISLGQFDQWLANQWKQKQAPRCDSGLSYYCDKYALFYRPPASNHIEECTFEICFDEDVEAIFASASAEYEGELRPAEVYRCKRRITLWQTERVGRETRTYQLYFNLPHRLDDQKDFYFEGEVSGFWEGLEDKPSTRALVVKKSLPNYNTMVEGLTRKFFGSEEKE